MKQHYALLLLLASILFAAITIFSLCLLEPKPLQKSSFASPSNTTGPGRKYGLDAYDALAGLPIRKRSGGSVLPMDSMLRRRAVESEEDSGVGEDEESEIEDESPEIQEQAEQEKEKEEKDAKAKEEQDSGMDSSSASSMAILSGLPIRKRTENSAIILDNRPTADVEGIDLVSHSFMRPKVLLHAEDDLDEDTLQGGSANDSQSDMGSNDQRALINACRSYRGILCTAGVRYAACMSQQHHNEKHCRLTIEQVLDEQRDQSSVDDESPYSGGTRFRQHRFSLNTLARTKERLLSGADKEEKRLLHLSRFAMRDREHRNALSGTVDVAQAREKAKMLGLMDGFLVDTDYPSPPIAQSAQHDEGSVSTPSSLGIILDRRYQI